jgi:hypothetical protein
MDLKDLFYFICAIIGILWIAIVSLSFVLGLIAKATEKRLERIKSLENN